MLQRGCTLPHTYFLLSLVFYDETDGLKRLKLTLKIRKNSKYAIDQNKEALFLISLSVSARIAVLNFCIRVDKTGL